VGTAVGAAAAGTVAVGGSVRTVVGAGVGVGAGVHALNNNVRARVEAQV
jgi:hypothetical protein